MGKEPSDLAFLALAQTRLGQSDKAHSTLVRLRELIKNPERAKDQEAQAFLREAETIELDETFPADPFARDQLLRLEVLEPDRRLARSVRGKPGLVVPACPGVRGACGINSSIVTSQVTWPIAILAVFLR